MARKPINPYVIVTGDRELNKFLRKLASPAALKAHRAALQDAAKIVEAHARNVAPVRSGATKRSLTTRAGRRSRGRISVRVTQRAGMMQRTASTLREEAFYGGFVEFGWIATGRPRSATAAMLLRGADEEVKTYRGTRYALSQLKATRRIRGRWWLRQAGKDKEKQAQEYWTNRLWQWVRQQS